MSSTPFEGRSNERAFVRRTRGNPDRRIADMKRGILSHVTLLLAGSCFLLGAGATVWDVILRSFAGRNLPGVIEFTTLSIGFGALLSIPVCYARDQKVTARLLSELSPRIFKHALGILGAVFSTVFAAMMLWITAQFAHSKWGGPETTQDLMLPMGILLTVVALTFAASLAGALYNLVIKLRGALRNA
jgi:TRAP-type C4-dicarboxylate transport system permease small subunit